MKSLEKAALILAEAEFATDEIVAARWGITSRTIRAYRTEVAKDPKISAFFLQKVKEISDRYIIANTKFLDKNLSALTDLIKQSIENIDSERLAKDPDGLIRAIASSIKIVGEMKLGSEALSDSVDPESSQPKEANPVDSDGEIRTAIIEPAKRTPPVSSPTESGSIPS